MSEFHKVRPVVGVIHHTDDSCLVRHKGQDSTSWMCGIIIVAISRRNQSRLEIVCNKFTVSHVSAITKYVGGKFQSGVCAFAPNIRLQ